MEPKEYLGEGWSWLIEKDRYVLNDGEYQVTRDIVEKYMKDWGRPITKQHIIAVCQKFYRMHKGIE